MTALKLKTALAAAMLLVAFHVLAANPPSIAGTWTLDAKLSDKAPRIIPADRNGDDGDESGHWHRHGAGEGGPPGAAVSEAARGFQQIFSASRLYITQQEPEVDVLYDGHRLRQIFTDGRGTVATASGSVRPELGPSIAGWDKGVLVVETTPQMDTHVVERITPSADNRTLTIKTEINHIGMKKPFTFTRVFVNPDLPPPDAVKPNSTTGTAQGKGSR